VRVGGRLHCDYGDSSGHYQGLLVSKSSGMWGAGIEVALPVNAGSNPHVSLGSVSCASAGACAAVGDYIGTSGNQQGLLMSKSSGTWRRGVKATVPANAGPNPGVSLSSVSCASAGNCTAVGDYLDSSGHFQGVLVSESSGTWRRGVKVTLPANADTNPGVILASVSCASAGNCTAAGNYVDSSLHYQGLLVSKSSGRWGTGVEVTLPANAGSNPRVRLGSVSCASAGNCTAAGRYYDSSNSRQGLLVSKSARTPGTGVEATLADIAPDPYVGLGSVSCASAGNCTAVGDYGDSSLTLQGLLVSKSAGMWGTGVEASLPANAGSDPYVGLGSVSCASAGNCTAAGNYSDGAGNQLGLFVSETSGTWGAGVEATLPANASPYQFVSLDSVSCASAGNCVAVGNYYDSSDNIQGLLLGPPTTRSVSVRAP
jgi:hypothetical protein